jgi:hypothetical protein
MIQLRKDPDTGARGWPAPAPVRARVALEFGKALGKGKTIRNFSAGSRIGRSLFLGADERAAIDRLTEIGDDRWGNHQRYSLPDLLDLADPEGEADLEGLAAEGDWLWVLGSHARTRQKPEKAEDECIDLALLADLKDTRPRCLLARLPLVEDEGGGLRPAAKDGKRRAGMLKQARHGNCLSKALRRDPLIGPFTKVPAKEGGLDIEGIAVCDDRVALGLRGPVIATHAVLVELKIEAKRSGRLVMAAPPVKRLLAMEGLGIRDLKRCGDDLLILAGPTTGLSGPCALYRWEGWAQDPPRDPERVRLHRPERIVELPFGRGMDHPEGLALWGEKDGEPRQILVIYDSPGKHRLDSKKGIIEADLFDLPG